MTPGEGHFFFGYYDKSPWHRDGHSMLACRATFMDRAPQADDELQIGLVDTTARTFRSLATTTAWNWQQGCMLQWLDGSRIVFNDRVQSDRDGRDGRGDRFVGVILDVETGERRELPMPVYSVAAGHAIASSLNFSRLHRLRPGYGYAGIDDPTADEQVPEDDGLWVMDLNTGQTRLALSIADAQRLLPDSQAGTAGSHWMNHAQFAPGGQRVAVLHRWETGEDWPAWRTRMLTLDIRDPRSEHDDQQLMESQAKLAGQVYPLIDDGMCSHYDWRDDESLVAFARVPVACELRDGFFVIQDRAGDATPIAADELTTDGHCSYSPDRRWILNDTYPDPDDHCRTLMVVRASDQAIFEVGRFLGPMTDAAEVRCDLHPRWSPDGRQVSIDSIHEGRRALYAIDLSKLIDDESMKVEC